MDKEKLIAEIKAMSVLELFEIVKALEEEFGVSAAATAVAVAGPAAAAEEVEEKTEFDVILKDVGAGGPSADLDPSTAGLLSRLLA